MTDQPEPAPEPTEDELLKIIEPWSWRDFEDTITGDRKLGYEKVRPEKFNFHLRVGYFMKRPMRVIISCGKFVWMKNDEEYTNCVLYPLDPTNPDQATYPSGVLSIPMGWRPAVSLYSSNPGWVNVTSSMPGIVGGLYPTGGGTGYSTYTITGNTTAPAAIASMYQQGLSQYTQTVPAQIQQAQTIATTQQYGGLSGLSSSLGKLFGW